MTQPNPTLLQHLQQNAQPVAPAAPVTSPPPAAAPVITPEVQKLLDGPDIEGLDKAALRAHYGLPPAGTPEAPAQVTTTPTPTPTVVPSSGKLAPPRPGELKAAKATTEPEKPGRKPRSDKGKPRASSKSKGSTTDELLLACASGGLTAEQAREYLALRDTITAAA